MKKRKKSQLAGLMVIAAVILLVYGYMKFFNGTFLYISTGFDRDELFKVDHQVTHLMDAQILLADARSEYENLFGSGIWSQTVDGVNFDDYVKAEVKAKLIRIRCMNLMAKEKGVVLSRTQKDAVTSAADVYWAGLTQDQRTALNATREKLETMFTEFAVAQALYEDMTASIDPEISADQARVISIQYICADSRTAIEAAKQRLDAGDIFYVVARDYNGEEYECELRRGEMEEAFETAAYDLKSGETSGIVEAGGRFYLIKCSSDNEKSKTEANKTALLEQHRLEVFNTAFEPYEAAYFVAFHDKEWKKLNAAGAAQLSVRFEEIYNTYIQ